MFIFYPKLKIRRRIRKLIDPDLASQFKSFSKRHSVASLCSFYQYFHDNFCDETGVKQHEFKMTIRLASRSHTIPVEVGKCNRHFSPKVYFLALPAC